MSDLINKTIKKVHESYAFKRPLPHLTDDIVARTIGAKFEKIDGVWNRLDSAEIALEFTDGSVAVFQAGYYGDPIEVEVL